MPIGGVLHIKFSWHEYELFDYKRDDYVHLINLLSRWLGDGTMPCEMRAEFPELEIGIVADNYEDGNPVEGEFIASWMWLEQSLGYRDNVSWNENPSASARGSAIGYATPLSISTGALRSTERVGY